MGTHEQDAHTRGRWQLYSRGWRSKCWMQGGSRLEKHLTNVVQVKAVVHVTSIGLTAPRCHKAVIAHLFEMIGNQIHRLLKLRDQFVYLVIAHGKRLEQAPAQLVG